MCHYVTLIAPCADPAAVAEVMDRHGRAAEPIDNPSIRKVLAPGERQYLTTRGHCDCGTILAPRRLEGPEEFEARLAREESKLARRGWSEAKIARALEDRRRSAGRGDGGGTDSLEQWAAALTDLGDALRLPYVGLFVRFYSGSVADERFEAARREAPAGRPLLHALSTLEHDEVTLFRTSRRPPPPSTPPDRSGPTSVSRGV